MSSFNTIFDQHNYFVWPNSTTLGTTFGSTDTIDAIFITNQSPAYVSSNCSCNGFKSYFTYATPSTTFTFGAWEKYSANGTQVLFDTTIDRTCSGTGPSNECFLTLHNDDGFGYNGWGTPIATVGYLMVDFNGRGTEEGILPVQYADPKPTTYIYPPAPTATTTISSMSSGVAETTTSAASGTTTLGGSTHSQTSAALATGSIAAAVPSTSKSISKGVVAGIAVGVSLFLALALLSLWFLFRRKNQKAKQFDMDEPKLAPAEKSTSDVALVERYLSPRSPTPSASTQGPSTTSPEALGEFIIAASSDHKAILDPPVVLRLLGDELSAPICNIWDAIAVRETYVSRLSPSIHIPTTLESLRKQANEIGKQIGATPPVMLSVTSTQWKDTVGLSQADRFKHSFAFSGATSSVVKKRLVVRRGDAISNGKKFEAHETWAVGNCTECQSYLGATPITKASLTIYVADGTEVEACASCKVLVDNFKSLHGIDDDTEETMKEESKRAELARQAVEREWGRMEEEYRTREMYGRVKKGGSVPSRLGGQLNV
ncbi:hypothetical protein N431DRAFT_545249 [Stipitochalara longipes BDJ]|nr:hypothetical protein N431DRAFT_545249 [Stipitochalara longipes BDJ]